MEENSIASISEDYEVITVAMNSVNDMEVTAYFEEKNIIFPVVIDENGAIAERFGVRGVPTSFIVDPDANIEFTEVGYTTELDLKWRLWLVSW